MQIAVMLFGAGVWLLVFWLGSTALEATGMERTKARFQALSAITGTGFTTREAESIVDHPKRRRIATWLILLGNMGIAAFIVGLILFVKTGMTAPPRHFKSPSALLLSSLSFYLLSCVS